MFGQPKKKKTIKPSPFFDYPAREKKKILDGAMREAVRMQQDLIKRYTMSLA